MTVWKAIYVSSGTLRGLIFYKKKNLSKFWALRENLSGLCQKNGRNAKTAIRLSRETLSDKCFLLEKKLIFDYIIWLCVKKSRTLANFFAKGVNTKTYVTAGTHEKSLFWKKIQFHIFSLFVLGNFELQENSRFVN